ncbi:hypothetical protein Tco_0851688 [Tanacetum coccineum]
MSDEPVKKNIEWKLKLQAEETLSASEKRALNNNGFGIQDFRQEILLNRLHSSPSTSTVTSSTSTIARYMSTPRMDTTSTHEVVICSLNCDNDHTMSCKLIFTSLLAMVDQEEVHDSLLAAKDAKRSEYYKLVALNDVIAEALEEIETQEVNMYILDGGNDGV